MRPEEAGAGYCCLHCGEKQMHSDSGDGVMRWAVAAVAFVTGIAVGLSVAWWAWLQAMPHAKALVQVECHTKLEAEVRRAEREGNMVGAVYLQRRMADLWPNSRDACATSEPFQVAWTHPFAALWRAGEAPLDLEASDRLVLARLLELSGDQVAASVEYERAALLQPAKLDRDRLRGVADALLSGAGSVIPNRKRVDDHQ